MDPLDALAADLRERLLAGAGGPEEEGDVHARIRALVDREAGVLAEDRLA
jgi:pilus assembly protein CpaF